jgi:transposase-like protein
MLSDRRNTRAARRFLAKALKIMRNWPPVSITTDKLGFLSEATAQDELIDTGTGRRSTSTTESRPIMVRANG